MRKIIVLLNGSFIETEDGKLALESLIVNLTSIHGVWVVTYGTEKGNETLLFQFDELSETDIDEVMNILSISFDGGLIDDLVELQ